MAKGVKKVRWVSGNVDVKNSKPTIIVALPNETITFGVLEWEDDTTEADKQKGVTWIWQTANRVKIIGELHAPYGKNFKFTIPPHLCGAYGYYIEASLSGKTDVRKTGVTVVGNCPKKITEAHWANAPKGNSITGAISYGGSVFLSLKTEGCNGYSHLKVEIYKKEGDKLITTISTSRVTDGNANAEVKTTFWQIMQSVESFYIKVKNPNNDKYIPDNNQNEKHATLQLKNSFVPPVPVVPTNNSPMKVGKPKTNYNDYARPGSFNISFEIDKEAKTVVPLGILDFENKYENPYFSFKYNLTRSNLDSLTFEILDEDRKVIYQMGYLKPIIVVAHKKAMVLAEVEKATPVFELQKPVKFFDIESIFKKHQIEPDDYTKVGEYIIHWDGFDNNEVYDSTIFNNKRLTARIKAVKGIEHKTIEVYFETNYDQVQWVDVKIDKKKKRIDTTLRVNLTDGGEQGLKCSTYTEDNTTIQGEPNPLKGVSITICPWDKIPEKEIYPNKPIIKTRSKSFKDLENLALDGIKRHWSRNNNYNIKINSEKYELFVSPINTKEKSLNELELIYNTNLSWGRSGNPGFLGKIYYNIGYCDVSNWYNFSNRWRYFDTFFDKIDDDFRYTSAHELGHTILRKYGGTWHSFTHAGSSHIWQSPNGSESYKTQKSNSDINLMNYFEDDPSQSKYDYNLIVASEKDVLSLLWLTKIKIK